VAGITSDSFKVYRPLKRVVIKKVFIDLNGQSHHFPGFFLHMFFIRSKVYLLRFDFGLSMAKITTYSKGFVIGTHYAIQHVVAYILG
jgi:hypothetical protein